jgi:hypothetical protein
MVIDEREGRRNYMTIAPVFMTWQLRIAPGKTLISCERDRSEHTTKLKLLTQFIPH